MVRKVKAAVLGASGYTGADLLRLGTRHSGLEFVALTANTHAGKPMHEVYPHLGHIGLPDLVDNDNVDWATVDVIFAGLPHGNSQAIVSGILEKAPNVRIIDMSADYRFEDPEAFAKTYGQPHVAPEIQKKAVYGLTEHYRDALKTAQIIACPGCYPTATLLTLLPLLKAGAISQYDLIIDAKSGVTGAGRSPKQNLLLAEAGESVTAYGVGTHRHAPEIEKEIAKVTGVATPVNFTPHLIPMSRGELITAHVKLDGAQSAADLRAELEKTYAGEPFIRIAAPGQVPATGHVRGSNYALINVFADRIPGRAIVIGAIDNLVKGSAGQALQNFNVAFGFEETLGLEQLPLFP